MTQVIDTFLESWKQSAKQHYITQVEIRNDLVAKQNELMEKYGLHSYRMNQVLPEDYVQAKEAVKAFKDLRSKSEYEVIARCVYADNPNNPTETLDSFLEKLLDKEVASKKATLIKKIEAKAGAITDAQYLTIGADGNINGYVTGSITRVRVETIYAGGHNIQCLHYRVLVK